MDIEHFWLTKSDWVPNNERLPVIVYRQINPDIDPAGFESLFLKNAKSIPRLTELVVSHFKLSLRIVPGLYPYAATVSKA